MSKTINVKFNLENNILPRDMERPLVSFFKSSIQQAHPEKYKEWYESGCTMKPFCWSEYYPGIKTHDEIKELTENWFYMNISCPTPEDFLLLFDAISKREGERIGLKGNAMTVEAVKISIVPHVTETSILVKTESPVIVRGTSKKYLTEKDPDFTQRLKETVEEMLLRLGHPGKADIIPMRTASVAVTAFGPTTANIGFFKINGSSETLEFLLSSGIGAKRSQGYGRVKRIK